MAAAESACPLASRASLLAAELPDLAASRRRALYAPAHCRQMFASVAGGTVPGNTRRGNSLGGVGLGTPTQVIDQHQQGGRALVLQSTLQGSEIEIVGPLQLLRLEQVRNDHDVERALLMGDDLARGTQRACETARGANHGLRSNG